MTRETIQKIIDCDGACGNAMVLELAKYALALHAAQMEMLDELEAWNDKEDPGLDSWIVATRKELERGE